MPTRNQLIATGVAVGVVGGLVGYAAWFDYKRRNDEGFRKKIREYGCRLPNRFPVVAVLAEPKLV